MKSLTEGKPLKLILLFAIPLLVGNLFQQLYSLSDTIIVGQTLGVNALAAVGSTGGIQFLIIGFAQGLTAGLSILTAQYFGAKDYHKVRLSFAVSIVITLVVTLLLTAFSLKFVGNILDLMQTPKAIEADAKTFISIIFGGLCISMAYNLMANIIRALGDSKTPLYFLIIATIVNVILELLFIVVFKWGIAGAGFATILAQSLSVVLCIIYIVKKLPLLQVKLADFKQITKKAVGSHLYVGLPMAFQASIIAVGSVLLQSALNSLGTVAVASSTAGSKIDQLASLPLMSFGVAMATFTAQNYGARKYERILLGVKQILMVSMAFALIAAILIITCGRQLVTLFIGHQSLAVLNLSQTYFRITCSGYWILGILFIIRYTLQGLGQSIVPTLAGVAELVMRSTAALILAKMFGYAGACFANPMAWAGSCFVLIPSYVKAHKMLKQRAQASLKKDK
ncbi:putative efflux protein, MATE family [Ligilactobacillus sp. WC1T17]|uniref:Efflux protein, MATE family n=1 Tax=Ligilactobacillus ruminis TaxID=1623 RepID=A0ABY1A9T0_9LACO|nr:putative efflux protein, MATE family [Ligilactobacillus ruminis]